jgi:hypothetical protein
MNENEYENESSDDEQSQQTMAASYANVVQTYLSDVINVNLSISLSM